MAKILRPPRPLGIKKGDWLDIVVKGKAVRACFIGNGKYSNAFRAESGNSVFIFTYFGDKCKEILSDCYRDQFNVHLPKMERVEKQRDVRIYKSKYYEQIRKFYWESWHIRKELYLARERAYKRVIKSPEEVCYKAVLLNHETLDQIRNVPRPVARAVASLCEISASYGDNFMLDAFTVRNTAVDAQGRIVLLDPIYDAKALWDSIMVMVQKMVDEEGGEYADK